MGVYNFTTEYNSKSINLVYKIMPEDKIDNVEHMMLTSNHIEGLLDVSYTSMDNLSYYKYNISSKITLARYLESEINKERLLKILMNIASTLKNIEDYLILPESILFDKEYIYIDVSSMEVDFICLPIEDAKREVDLKFLIKDTLYTAKFVDYENTTFISSVLNFINTNNQIVVDELIKLLAEEEITKNVKNTNAVVSKDNSDIAKKIRKIEVSTISEDDVPNDNINANNKINDKKIVKKNDNSKDNKENKSNILQDLINIGSSKKTEDKDKQESSNNKKQAKPKEDKKNEPDDDNGIVSFVIPGMDDNIGAGTKKSNKHDKVEKNKKENDQKPKKEEAKGFENKLESLFSKFKKDKPNDKTKNKSVNNSEVNLFMDEEIVEDSIIQPDLEETTCGFNNNSSETILLDKNSMPNNTAYLIRTKDDEKIFITKDLFKIGKEATYADYIIRDNSTISRSHADISKVNDKYFIQDNNSKNHTYVNHELVSPNEKVELNHNATITLSNEDFIFKLY